MVVRPLCNERQDASTIAVCHPGMQHAPWLVSQLERIGMLSEFWTGVAVCDQGLFKRWLRPGVLHNVPRLLAKRIVREVPEGKIHLRPWHEIVAALRKRAGLEEQRVLHTRNRAFQRALPEAIFRRNKVVVGFDTTAWILAERCAASGALFVLDQSIGHPVTKERIYAQVRERFPLWAEGLEIRVPEILAAELAEQRMATRIVVASSFTRRTLMENGTAAARITVNPYGVDATVFTPRSNTHEARPLRFAYVGQVTARKGIPLLLEVWNELAPGNAELWIIGHVSSRVAPLVAGNRNVVLKGAVSHLQVGELLRQCDIFVFPSYFEGFGLVLLEAMACGLPSIASDATAAPDLITDGVEGWVIQAGDGAALTERLRFFLSNPSRAAQMGQAARAKAEQLTWNAYGDRWASMLREIMRDREAA